MFSRRIKFYQDNWKKRQIKIVMSQLGKTSSASLSKKLKKIRDEIIIEYIGMADMPLILYVLSLKYDGKIDILPKQLDSGIFAGGRFVADMSFLAVYIHFIELKGMVLHIEGNVSQPTIFKERCSFGVKNNEEWVECSCKEMNLDLKKLDVTYETRTAFSVDIPLQKGINKITFYNRLDEQECIYGKINSMRFAPVADVMEGQYCVRDNKLIYIDRNCLICKETDSEEVKAKEEYFQKCLVEKYSKDGEWAVLLRKEYFERKRNKQKPIWLFMDRPDRADDNAEALFKYAKKQESVECYFVLSKDSKDRERIESIGNVVDVYSKEHYLLVMLADCIISSQCNGVVENPFWEKAEFFRDLYHQAKIVFLQHGVIKDDMSSTLSKYNTNFTGFVTSSVDEYNSILNYPYFYEKDQVWLTGLPRFDYLYSNPKKYILVMPSWRKGLMEQVWNPDTNNMEWCVKRGFENSLYAKRYKALLSHPRLREVCKQHGYQIAFMPHALIEPFIDIFVNEDECVYWGSEKSYREAFAEGNLLVTDFSSVVFDFAYLGKPIVYYQFDKEQFFEEHTYSQGYFEYEKDGFGEVVYDEETLLQLLVDYIEADCKVKDEYKQRMNRTFKHHDENNCERVFKHIMNSK